MFRMPITKRSEYDGNGVDRVKFKDASDTRKCRKFAVTGLALIKAR
jgi:hypothetical protein